MLSAFPFLGNDLVEFIWGGFSIGEGTLTRFYALHFLLPFILLGAVIIHLIYLHATGSNNSLAISTHSDKLPFHPYFIYKDLFGFLLLFLFYIILIVYFPNLLAESDNYIAADPLVTPASIVPEFYFLPFYAILRAIPSKLFGVLAMFSAILVLFLLPLKITRIKLITTNTFSPLGKVGFWLFVANFLLLAWLGGVEATSTNIILSQISTVLYFTYLLV